MYCFTSTIGLLDITEIIRCHIICQHQKLYRLNQEQQLFLKFKLCSCFEIYQPMFLDNKHSYSVIHKVVPIYSLIILAEFNGFLHFTFLIANSPCPKIIHPKVWCWQCLLNLIILKKSSPLSYHWDPTKNIIGSLYPPSWLHIQIITAVC